MRRLERRYLPLYLAFGLALGSASIPIWRTAAMAPGPIDDLALVASITEAIHDDARAPAWMRAPLGGGGPNPFLTATERTAVTADPASGPSDPVRGPALVHVSGREPLVVVSSRSPSIVIRVTDAPLRIAQTDAPEEEEAN